MRWSVALGLGILGGVDLMGALLVAPASAGVLVFDPLRPDGVNLARAALGLVPGIAIGAAVGLTCGGAALAVLARQQWARSLALILAVLHLPVWVVSLPLMGAALALPATGRASEWQA